ncbi:hypothetical protein LCGC14_2854680 [marine sediment metagenome]|uniref:Uncharacterized protein n=1 Tax=marine sediment metagenome TaxID=412755 RepID=A0A0F8Y7K7_9ZZZZ
MEKIDLDESQLQARIDTLEAAFQYLCDNSVFVGFVHVKGDRHEYAARVARVFGHEEPTPEDEREGFILMIMEAMAMEKDVGVESSPFSLSE